MRLNDYLRIMRPDHWVKNIFMLPGVAVALMLKPTPLILVIEPLVLAVVALCLAASANYVINEYLDAEFDRFHPVKQSRAVALGRIDGRVAVAQYAVIAIFALLIAGQINRLFLGMTVVLLVMGVIYNVRPFRAKDRAYWDVVTESVNNPLRFMMGWAVVVSDMLPPSSILMAYWFGGAFLMAVKRFSEYRSLGAERAGAYRRSFQHYSELSLLLSSIFYGINSTFFLGVFLIKYHVEFLLSFPLFAILFTWYLGIGFKANSATQHPEFLFREKKFMLFVAFLTAVVVALFFVNIPAMQILVEPIVP